MKLTLKTSDGEQVLIENFSTSNFGLWAFDGTSIKKVDEAIIVKGSST